MSDEQQTAGTTDGGNAQATGTPVDGNAEDLSALKAKAELADKLEREKAQWLAEKGNYEDLKRQVAANGPAGGQPPAPAAGGQAQELQQAYAQLQLLAAQGDLGAKWQLAQVNELQRVHAQNQYLAEMLEIPDTRRSKVNEIVTQYRVTPRVAQLMLDGMEKREAEQRIAELEERVKQNTSRQTVHTATVGVTASEVGKGIYKGDEYARTISRLKAEGKDGEVAALMQKRRKGEIQIVP